MSIFRNAVLPDDDVIMRAAREALTHPPDSAFSDRDLFVTWGLTISMTRDSALDEVSNFERIAEDMTRVFPADVRTVHAGHWGNGWMDELAVRVLEPWADPDEFTARDITRAFRVIVSVATYLREQYPVYDDSDLAERESEAMAENRAEAWAGVRHQLWLAYDIEDVTEGDRTVFDEAWEAALDEYGYAEAYVDENDVVNKIIRVRNLAQAWGLGES